jgi:hypothetical protein
MNSVMGCLNYSIVIALRSSLVSGLCIQMPHSIWQDDPVRFFGQQSSDVISSTESPCTLGRDEEWKKVPNT